ncbi:cytochrome c [Maritimibacter sp. DP1N21-5]|uniref:c-type cytochrome n=1 Tax=Maritimibacter sp. DP1N21-5 TaxID=2836867 RepID=UPI001C44DF47|nr:cytochrome c [Maritimibacter sp. DP1N21-5]MBV7409851.1 cytochrome c [Maritimibacter sp. DP1N21-5]
MTRRRTLFLGLAGGIAGASIAATAVLAQEGLNPVVKARHAQMTLFAFNLGTLGAMAQDKAEYDAEAATAAAGNIVKLSSLAAGPMWAPGTGVGDVEGTRALPAIWENMDDVITKAVALNEAAVAMEAAAGEGLDSLKAAFGPLGAACGECHKSYREPE